MVLSDGFWVKSVCYVCSPIATHGLSFASKLKKRNPFVTDDCMNMFVKSILAKEHVCCNGRENITHTLNSTTITQDHNRSIFFIFARHHICVAAYPPSHPRRRWPRCLHKTTKNVCWVWLILRRVSLPPSSLSLSLSRSLSLTLAMRNLLFSPATFFRDMHVYLSMFSFPYMVIVGCLFAIRIAAGMKKKNLEL